MTEDRCPACLDLWRACKCAHYCGECGCYTNHTTAQHEAEERAMEGEEP